MSTTDEMIPARAASQGFPRWRDRRRDGWKPIYVSNPQVVAQLIEEAARGAVAKLIAQEGNVGGGLALF